MADDEYDREETIEDGAQPARVVRMNYPPNSKKSQEEARSRSEKPAPEEKKVKKVISGEAVQRKKSLGRKIKETFTGDDMHSVGTFIVYDILVPSIKTMLSDVLNQGADRMLFGDSRSRRVQPQRGGSRYTSDIRYDRMSHPAGRAGESDRRDLSPRARANHDFNEVVLASRGEAEEVLDRLVDLIREYDVATVSDLYELVGITGSFADQKWGWSDLRGARVENVRGGFLLNLPRTRPID